MYNFKFFGILVITLSTIAIGCANVYSGDRSEKSHTGIAEVDINKVIQDADTPEDHLQLAAYYDREASLMEAKAKKHLNMAESYKKTTKRSARPGHCLNLAEKFNEAAAEYRTLASEHRKIAEEL